MATPPVRLRPSNNSNNYDYTIIPGITTLNLNFDLLDYYENNVITITGK